MALTVSFFEPPPRQAEGGLERAIEMLDAHFESQEVHIQRRATASEIWNHPPDLVHFHGLWQPDHAWASWLCRRLGIPYIVSPHGMLEPWAWAEKRWKKRPYYWAVERCHLHGADCVLATSDQEASNLQAFVPASRLCSIPLAITEPVGPGYSDARDARGWPEDERVLLYLSRVHPKKGLHLLLEALVELSARAKKDTRLVVVGPGPDAYVDRLKSYCRQNREQLPPVDWEGPVWGGEKWSYLQGADLMCLPTHSENFGIVILESLQVGTPVLTTDTTPWNFLEEWSAGFVTSPNVEEIREALTSFVGEFTWTDAERHQLGRQTTERFSLSSVGVEYFEMYKSVVEGQGVGEIR